MSMPIFAEDTRNMSLQSPDGGAAMGGIAAHGYVNGKAGADRQG